MAIHSEYLPLMRLWTLRFLASPYGTPAIRHTFTWQNEAPQLDIPCNHAEQKIQLGEGAEEVTPREFWKLEEAEKIAGFGELLKTQQSHHPRKPENTTLSKNIVKLASHLNLSLVEQDVLMATAWIGQVEAAEKPFKFEILPSEKCVLKKIELVDPELKCLNLKASIPVGVPISPTKPGDPMPDKRPGVMANAPSEMQQVLHWCKKKRGAWAPDGANGGTCRFPAERVNSDPIFDRWGKMKTKQGCETEGGVWDGGAGQGGCTGPQLGRPK